MGTERGWQREVAGHALFPQSIPCEREIKVGQRGCGYVFLCRSVIIVVR